MTLAPVIDQVAAGLNITPATAGLLAGIPVFCFALTVPLASWVMRRAGLEAAVTISLIAVLLGTIIRSLDGPASAFAGMAVIGLGITIGNITVPVIIGRDFPNSVSSVSGMYTAALNMGSVITTLGTAPLAQALGWRWAIACWGALAILALIIWRKVTTRLLVRTAQPTIEAKPAAIGRIWRRWDVWALAVAFGCQSFSYYGITAWLPTLLTQEQGLSSQASGAYSATFQLFAIAGALGVPLLRKRGVPVQALAPVLSVLWLALPAGLLLAPGLFMVWTSLAGIAQGGTFTVLITLMVQRSRSQAEGRSMSALVQGFGYVLAAIGPYTLGSINTWSGNWTAPLLTTLGALTVMGATILLVASAGPYRPLRPTATG